MSFSAPKSKTLKNLIEKEGPNGTGRIIGLSIEDDGVFIYTNSADWDDGNGSGTFRADTECGAVNRFKSNVTRNTEGRF
jgi:hypothetical protein